MTAHTPGPYLKGSGFDRFTGGFTAIYIDGREYPARLIAAAAKSYLRHCSPRAIEAAEGDLLGEALAALANLLSTLEAIMSVAYVRRGADARLVLDEKLQCRVEAARALITRVSGNKDWVEQARNLPEGTSPCG